MRSSFSVTHDVDLDRNEASSQTKSELLQEMDEGPSSYGRSEICLTAMGGVSRAQRFETRIMYDIDH